MRRERSDMEKSLAHPKRGARDVSMAPVVLLCAVLVGGGVARGDVVRDVLEEVAPSIELPEGGVTVAQVLESVQSMEAVGARLVEFYESGWMMGPSVGNGRTVSYRLAHEALYIAKATALQADMVLEEHGADGDRFELDRLVQARVSLVGLRSARASLVIGAMTEDAAEARAWFERGAKLVEASEGVSAWTRAERAVLLGQAHVLLGDGAGALRVIRGAQESLRDATRVQRMEALMALVRGTAQAAGIAEAEGVWRRIVDRPPFVEEGRVDVGAKAMAIGVLTQARLEASEGVAERRRVRREASDALARLLGEIESGHPTVYVQLGRMRDPSRDLDEEPLSVLVGMLFDGDTSADLVEALCRVDVRTVPEGNARKQVMLAGVVMFVQQNDPLNECAIELTMRLLEEYPNDPAVSNLPALILRRQGALATPEQLARAQAIEREMRPGKAKGNMRLAIARAMVEAWDWTGEPPDIDAVLAELYEDELRERGVEFRRAFWKRVLLREEDRVAAGGEITSRGIEAAIRLGKSARNPALHLDVLDRSHAGHVMSIHTQWISTEMIRENDGFLELIIPDRKIIPLMRDLQAYALRARMALTEPNPVDDALRALFNQDERMAERTWRVMLLFDTAHSRLPELAQLVGLDRDPVKFGGIDPLEVLRAARWGVEEQGYELTPGMRRVLLRCSASARDQEFARWLAETIGDRVRGGEERLLLGEAWLAAGEDERAFGVYRQLALDLEADDPRAYEYWASYARMLEILERKNEMGGRSVEMRREIDRLRALPGYELFEDARWAIDKVARSVDR